MIYIFNVEDVLSPMGRELRLFFFEWVRSKKFVLFSGLDYTTVERSVGKTIVSLAQSTYCNHGKERWQNFRPVSLSSIDEDYSDSPLTVFKGSNDRGFWLYNLWENVENLYQINNVGETKNALQECFVRNLNCQI